MGVNSLPKTVTRQRRGCDLNPDPSAPESSTLTTLNEMTEDRAVTLDAAPNGVQRVPVDATTARCQSLATSAPPSCDEMHVYAILPRACLYVAVQKIETLASRNIGYDYCCP